MTVISKKDLKIVNGWMPKHVALVIWKFTPITPGHCAAPMGSNVLFIFNDNACIINPKTTEIGKRHRLNVVGQIWAVYSYKDDYILQGELTIYRMNKALDLIWGYSAQDIFVRRNGKEPAFDMKSDRICLYDWLDNYYEIDYDGNEQMYLPSKQES